MTAMPEATLRVELDRVRINVTPVIAGFSETTFLVVSMSITNVGREPYALNAGSVACWMELSPDQPGETRAMIPNAGGPGSTPGGKVLGSVTIPPGETRRFWVRFQGYRYPGSDVPRKITVFIPDARGQRVQLVIADPGRGQRWMVDPLAFGFTYGIQQTSLSSPEVRGQAIAAQLGGIGR